MSAAAAIMEPSNGTTMSVTQALAELKLLRKRMDAGLEDAVFVKMHTKRSTFDVNQFKTRAQASYQSYMDLLERFNRIKSAIAKSNASTTVRVADKDYTVAEAVERKRNIDLEKEMLLKMKSQMTAVLVQKATHEATEKVRVDRLLQTELGKDARTNIDVIKGLTDTFMAENEATIVDPLNLTEKIEKMTNSIDEFEMNVDWVLSEANGRTTIVV